MPCLVIPITLLKDFKFLSGGSLLGSFGQVTFSSSLPHFKAIDNGLKANSGYWISDIGAKQQDLLSKLTS